MEHYFTNNEALDHQLETIHFTLKGQPMTFTTDNGVFSKSTIDYGSRVLIDACHWDENVEGKILDVGCGYGPIGLSLAKFFDKEADLIDVNERAMDLAKRNARQNGLTKQVHIFKSDGYENVKDTDYAMIVTNPPIRAGKAVVHRILEEAYHHLTMNGSLWVVIQKKQGAPSAKKKMEAIFGNCQLVKKDKGYYILKSIKN